jgi:hypothetical protein
MKEQKNSGGVAARNIGPFTRNAASIDRNEIDIVSNGPDGTYLVKTLPPLNPADRSRF